VSLKPDDAIVFVEVYRRTTVYVIDARHFGDGSGASLNHR
jgi:hypothetical protein